MKKISLHELSEKERFESERECKLLAGLSHQNILEYVDSFLENDTLHIVTQYCEIGKPNLLVVRFWMYANEPIEGF